ncbi:phosphopantetheine-binding protein [Desulfolutivibrio sulfodismutans]|nr:phosphopantetheine-binding protein [Desulfolutivibrio sulfodismutans]
MMRLVMTATLDDLKRLIVRTGLSPQTADRLDPAVPLTRQGVDSIAHPLFILAVEERFGVHVSEEQALTLRTLDDFMAMLNMA